MCSFMWDFMYVYGIRNVKGDGQEDKRIRTETCFIRGEEGRAGKGGDGRGLKREGRGRERKRERETDRQTDRQTD